MKRLTVIVVLALLVTAVGTADVFDWTQDLDAALERAEQEDKAVFLYFAGTDWCGWCHRLMDEVLHAAPFEEYATEALVPVLIDFPREGEQSAERRARNNELAKRYEISGFPTVFLLSPAEEVILQTGYLPGGPANYINRLRSAINEYQG
ncbi:MAG: thioredoxin fold domain-containing protein [Spirochaetes bacterium]|jgi:protein disulfide-isomerase|nr:thioredoxin fold domain-containing protein [Spirochaetota bacterium]